MHIGNPCPCIRQYCGRSVLPKKEHCVIQARVKRQLHYARNGVELCVDLFEKDLLSLGSLFIDCIIQN